MPPDDPPGPRPLTPKPSAGFRPHDFPGTLDRRMALYAFDGTWNVQDEKDAILAVQPSQYGDNAAFLRLTVETNVHRFREFVGLQYSEYLHGVRASRR